MFPQFLKGFYLYRTIAWYHPYDFLCLAEAACRIISSVIAWEQTPFFPQIEDFSQMKNPVFHP